MAKDKICSGTGKAVNYGCGKPLDYTERNGLRTYDAKYGLGKKCKCYRNWLLNSDEGKAKVERTSLKSTGSYGKKVVGDWNKERSKRKIGANSNKYKTELGEKINLLSRMIDKSFNYETCIDCELGYGPQTDASHFHNVAGNENLRWNLHVLHSSNSHCNRFHGGRKEGYYKGLVERYGKEYADYVKFEIPKLYPRTSLSSNEIYEALKLVRKIIRDYDTFVFNNALQARQMLNKLIGIYSKDSPKMKDNQ